MVQQKEYFAFISYKREDEKWAKWLANELEHYHLPTTLNGKDLPKRLRPIFRDVDELSAGNLPEQIYHALSISKNLIVVCSPRSAKSEWVNKEIEDFRKIKGGKSENIYPFIIEGIPFSKDTDKECFPEKLRNLPENEERLGGNINEQGGRKAAVVKIIAGMLGVGFDSLWQKYERERRKNRNWLITATIIAFLCIFGIASWMYWQNWKMKVNRARFVAEKINTLIDEDDYLMAKLLALHILPPNSPYTAEAELVLRRTELWESSVIKHNKSVKGVAFSPDGNLLTTISTDGRVRIWNSHSGRLLMTIEGNVGTNHASNISFCPNGKYIAAAFWDKIYVWNAETGELIHEPYEGHTGTIYSVTFSPTGDSIVSASTDKTIRIWSVHKGEINQSPMVGHTSAVCYASFSPNGKYIVSASGDSTAIIWDVKSGKRVLSPLIGHNSYIYMAEYSPDGNRIVTASGDSTVIIWNAKTGKQIFPPLKGHKGAVLSASFNSDGSRIVTASMDSTLILWDAQTGGLISKQHKHSNTTNFAQFSPSDDYIASASEDKTVRIWNLNVKKPVVLYGHTGAVYSVNYSSDGKFIVSASEDGTLRLWDAKSLKLIREPFLGHNKYVTSAIFDLQGETVLSVSGDCTIRQWDSKTGKEIRAPLNGHDDAIHSISLSKDGKTFVTSSSDNSIKIWDTNTYILKKKIDGFYGNYIYYATYSPNGKYIISINLFGFSPIIWDSNTGMMLKDDYEGHFHNLTSVIFCNDNNFITASKDKTLRLWDINKKTPLLTMEGHTDKINSLALSPNGKYALSTSDDKTIRVWELNSGVCVLVLEGHMSSVNAASFSPDGKQIVSASSDGIIYIWDFLPLQELIDKTHERFKDCQLTPEERRKYYLE